MKKYVLIILVLISVVAVTSSLADTTDNKSPGYTFTLEIPRNDKIPEFKLPESVKIIEDEAFEGTSIVKVDLPYSVSEIGERAFANIKTLRAIQIPTTTKKIASTAFAGSNQVTIHAAPDSYARKYARAMGMLFAPVASFCAAGKNKVNIIRSESAQKDIDIESTENQIPDRQWHRIEEIKVVGTLDLIFYEIQGRGPPMGEEKC